MRETNYTPLCLQILGMKDGKITDRKIVSNRGYLESHTNHDGSIDQYIHVDLTKTQVGNNRYNFENSEIYISFNDQVYIVDYQFVHPKKKRFMFRVSPLAA